MSFFEFQVNSHSTSVDSHASPVPSLPLINTTPESANPFSQSAYPVRATTPGPSSLITPLPTAYHTSVSNSSTHLNQGDQLVLVRLCVLNQSDYADRKKGEFWTKISILLQQETRKRLKNPASTMKLLVAGHRVCIFPF